MQLQEYTYGADIGVFVMQKGALSFDHILFYASEIVSTEYMRIYLSTR